jgi:hypothetical protein
MRIRDAGIDDIAVELQYVLDTRHERLAIVHRWVCSITYRAQRALYLALLRYWGRR